MAATRIRKSRRAEASKGAHSRFLKTAPSLVALLGIDAGTGKSDAQLFNELLANDGGSFLEEKKQAIPNKSKKKGKKNAKKGGKKTTKTPKKKKKKGKTKATKAKKAKQPQDKAKKTKKAAPKKKESRKDVHFAAVTTSTTSVPNNLNLLKQRAQAELRRLANENDELFHEKETLRIQLTDLQDEVELLKETMTNNEGYKDTSDRLRLMVENYKSELTTLQTEGIMLRELLNEYTQNNNADGQEKSPIPLAADDADSQEKMETVKKLVKEKNDILNEFEELKLMYSAMVKDNATFKNELKECKSEITVLSEKLAKEQNRYLRENERNAERIDKLAEDMKMNKDELLIEYERKEQQFIQTVEEQLKYIDELENENEDLQLHHTRHASIGNQQGGGMFSLLKMKTQANIFSGPDHGQGHPGGNVQENGGNYSMSFDDDDQYEFLSDSYGDDHYDDYTPIASPGSGDGTYIEHGASTDVADLLLVQKQSDPRYTPGYGTPNTGAMSNYWDQLQHAKHKELDEEEQMKQEEEQRRLQANAEEERQKKEQILAVEQQQNELDHNDLAVLVGKMKENNKPIEQTSIRALGYFIHKNGRLLPLSLEKNDTDEDKEKEKDKDTEEKEKEEEEEEEHDIGLISMEMDDHVLEQLKSALTIYLFDTLLKYYKFRPKQIGNIAVKRKKKNKLVQIDYSYKTLLFSSNFTKSDTLFVIIPPYRGGICYWNLCIDKGIVYGTLLPYIEFALSYGNGKCSTLILDPKGIDSNDTPWSIFKIYDKFIAKRIRSGKLKKIVFIGALKEGNLVSHLLDRRGKELKNVVKCCVFLGCDDPYMTKPLTAKLYEECAVNYINSSKPIGEAETGTKPNGDKYFIPRSSAGMNNFCCISAYSAVVDYVKNALSSS
eukprot:610359_1